MLCMIVPSLFVGCLGAFSIILFMVVAIIIIWSLLQKGGFEENIGSFVIAFILFLIAFIVNLIGWIAVWIGK